MLVTVDGDIVLMFVIFVWSITREQMYIEAEFIEPGQLPSIQWKYRRKNILLSTPVVIAKIKMNFLVPHSLIESEKLLKFSWPVLSRLIWNDLQHLGKVSYSECLYFITSIVFKLNLWQISDRVGSLKPSLDSPDRISFWRSSDGNNTCEYHQVQELQLIWITQATSKSSINKPMTPTISYKMIHQ